MKQLFSKFENFTNKLQDLALLGLRLVLAYGFWEPAKTKWSNIEGVVEWFGSIGIPAPALNAYLAATIEMTGVFLLILGLGIRLISIPLMITMVVAIKTVHWENGFSAGENGWEIPFYYMLMLFVLLAFGAGRISVDFLIKKIRK
jgi:putative oxidoreductase